MNAFKKTLLALGIGLAATAITRAQEVPVERTRAEVIAELDAARSGGELGVLLGEDSGSFHLASQPMAWTRQARPDRGERSPDGRRRQRLVLPDAHGPAPGSRTGLRRQPTDRGGQGPLTARSVRHRLPDRSSRRGYFIEAT
jgi:hypothetical protein